MWKLLFCALVQKNETKLEYLNIFIIQILIWGNNAEKISHLTDTPIKSHRFTLINLASKSCMTDYYKWVGDDKIMHGDQVVAEAHSANIRGRVTWKP